MPDKAFKVIVMKMFTGLERTMNEVWQNFKKGISNVEK